MKLATLKDGRLVVISDNEYVPLEKVGFEGTMLDLIQAGTGKLESLAEVLKTASCSNSLDRENLDAPLNNPSKIVAIGLNYVDHASESKMELPESPLVFTKFPSSITAPFGSIRIPENLTNEVDYEAELGVVIGRKAKNVPLNQALSYVFGYTVLNDVSARDLQFGDKQWVRGKSLDTFCPMGPFIITADEIPDPQNLEIGCSVNGQTLQDANTKDMIFNVADLISQLSYSFTLEPGDIIATGTPSGVGFSRKPPVLLKPGDTVKTWVKGIGELVNPVKKA
ncbi:MAG TPA: fumarylacetoacetate hydrolase family protein [Balneolales bacterium]|nr:fumarylacetoacetate hydrolase family protein [Balneolales bacterium]